VSYFDRQWFLNDKVKIHIPKICIFISPRYVYVYLYLQDIYIHISKMQCGSSISPQVTRVITPMWQLYTPWDVQVLLSRRPSKYIVFLLEFICKTEYSGQHRCSIASFVSMDMWTDVHLQGQIGRCTWWPYHLSHHSQAHRFSKPTSGLQPSSPTLQPCPSWTRVQGQVPTNEGFNNRYSSGFQIRRNRTGKPTIPSG
jgi:hypothetical protein